MSAALILAGSLLAIVSGLLAILPALRQSGSSEPSSRASGERVSEGRVRGDALPLSLHLLGSLAGLTGCALGLAGPVTELALPWHVPGGAIVLRVDALAAFFAAPVFLVCAAGAIYAERYWPRSRGRAAYVRCFYGILSGALPLVMVAGHTMFFLAAWEIVTLSAFFLVGTETDDAAARSASWLYLAASHVALLALFAAVALLHKTTGSWRFEALPSATSPEARAIFWLVVIGCGVKAGAMPLHFWLPAAHAAAPSHVSAVMSGVVIKMGIYGLVRMLSLFPQPPSWMGGTLLAAGIVSSILGVAFALAQHDLKRLLAYHSVENIGIILVGLGAGLVARAHGATVVAFLAFAGGLLHVWNHALFKSLLFLGAGAAIHGTHTREMDHMGGLARRMPSVAAAFLLGAIAICGLPPLNGFVSEWLIYLAGFAAVTSLHAGWEWLMLVAVAPALALTGALAMACFVKAFGTVFLGSPRSPEAAEAHDVPRAMRTAMLPLAAGCLAIGLLPAMLAPMLERLVAETTGIDAAMATTLGPLQVVAIALAVLLVVAAVALRRLVGPAPAAVTWDCGYAAPTARMQYTASSLARTLVSFFAWAMPGVTSWRAVERSSEGAGSSGSPARPPARSTALFPPAVAFETHVPDTVLDRALLPVLGRVARALALLRTIQGGRVQLYLVYVAAALLALLVWSSR